MSNNANEIVVAANGSINVAPYGTTLPIATATPVSSLNAAFKVMGYASEDGVVFNTSRDIVDRMAWQSQVAVRRDEQGRENTFTTTLLQWNEDTIKTAFGGGAVENVALNVYSYVPPAAGEPLEELSLVIDWQDNDKDYRLIVPKVTIDGDTEVALTRADMAVLPIAFKALEDDVAGYPWKLVSNDPAFVGAGS